ncbi:MAG: FxsA family protein, partial [Candidatus Omnitrophica bacterium]|nr:FxsA family protein [Candidatus Omnitrophota bacterium]
GVVGAALARLQGFLVIRKIQLSLNGGNLPSAELLDGLMILVGGIVLLTPGFITDALGLLLLIPFTRGLIKHLVRHKMEAMVRSGQFVQMRPNNPGKKSRYDDIDI